VKSQLWGSEPAELALLIGSAFPADSGSVGEKEHIIPPFLPHLGRHSMQPKLCFENHFIPFANLSVDVPRHSVSPLIVPLFVPPIEWQTTLRLAARHRDHLKTPHLGAPDFRLSFHPLNRSRPSQICPRPHRSHVNFSKVHSAQQMVR
jgi:hypothetical protein